MTIFTEQIRHLTNYIGGEWVNRTSKQKEIVVNPATGKAIAEIHLSTKEDVDYAVQIAKKAWQTWSKTPVPKRAQILFKYQQLLVEHKENLAKIITIENGKSLTASLDEVHRGIQCVEFAAGVPSLMMGKQLPDVAENLESGMYRYPLGVIGGITSFNFPMMVPCWMFPIAIACGNTFVLKPSERTPLLAANLVELFEEAGLPKGVLNIVNGAHDAVNALLEHKDVKAISFVGSQPVAEYVYKKGTSNLKRVQALSGAKNHSIVLKDADLNLAAKEITSSAFGSAGERCLAASVLAVEESIADELIGKLVEEADQITVGNGLNDGVFLGPVIQEYYKKRTLHYIKTGLSQGAKLVRDGRKDEVTSGAGYFIGPTIFDNITQEMKIWQEEIFAPVLAVIRVKDLTEAIHIANASKFANGACLYTDSAAAIRTFRENIDAGMLGVNIGIPAPMAFFPFSGYKDSFYGDLHTNGTDGIEFYTRKKVITGRY